MTLTIKITGGILLLLSLFACDTKAPPPVEKSLRPGEYDMLFHLAEVDVPVLLRVDNAGRWTVENASEHIPLDSLTWKKKSFHVKMPLFNTSLEGEMLTDSSFQGKWTDHTRDTLYQVPFTAVMNHRGRRDLSGNPGTEKIYDATFSPASEDPCKAVGVFTERAGGLTGTFLTESGDYRFLAGSSTGESMHLSCFDGAHLFYFCANISGDSLKDGKFYSGRHWAEDWEARLDPSAQLHDPDSLTYVVNPDGEFRFKVRNVLGDSILFDADRLRGKVSIVQIFGSWCPNCTDESRFFGDMYEKYKSAGLEIIPVAFERKDDFELARTTVQGQFSELGLPYSPYFGGKASKGQAAKVFSALDNISSYPTAIFVDRRGRVRKIHTGFYGPGTGEHYQRHTRELDAFLQQLVAETL